MIRMLEVLEPHIALIACEDAPGPWRGINTFRMSRNDFLSRALRKLFGNNSSLMLLKLAIKRRNIKKLLINFATMAVQTRRAWEDLNVEVFVHCHGWDVHFDARSDKWPHPNIHSTNYIEAVRKLSNRVIYIANSQHTKNILMQNGIPELRIRLKRFGVEDRGDTPSSGKQASRQLKLLYLGRLVDFKGPDLVIKAFDVACGRGLSAELVVAGDGPLLSTCELLATDSPFKDKIRIHGPVDRDLLRNFIGRQTFSYIIIEKVQFPIVRKLLGLS